MVAPHADKQHADCTDPEPHHNLAMISEVLLWTFGTTVAVLVIVGLVGLATAIAGAILSSPIALLALLLGLGLDSGDD